MATARVCKVSEVPAATLFAALVDWGGWGSWLPVLQDAVLERGGPGVAGSVRVLGSPDAPVRERLVGCDEVALTLAYIIEGRPPFPARTYAAWVKLLPLTDRVATVVEWTASFDADADVEAQVRGALEGYFAGFIDALSASVGASA